MDELGLVSNIRQRLGSSNVNYVSGVLKHLELHILDIDFVHLVRLKMQEAAEELPSYYDAIELDENGEVNLRELVEDELILAIPLIPRHELEQL